MIDRRAGTGLIFVLFAGSLAVAGWHFAILGPSEGLLHLLVDLVVFGGTAGALLYGGYWHTANDISDDRYPRIFAWVALGALLLLGLGVVVIYVGSRNITPGELLEAEGIMGVVGVTAGLLFGTLEADRTETVAAVTRERTRANHLAAERERMDRLNDLMRHYLLNSVNVILGQVDLLAPAVPPEERERLDTIQRRAETVETLVEHIDSLAAVERGEVPAREMALATVVREAVADASTPDDQTVDHVECAGSVQAPRLLYRVVILLVEALGDCTDDDGTIALTCERDGAETTIRLSGTPTELPPVVERSLFEPISDGVGLKLYLADGLLGMYGDLELVESGGETVTLRLSLDS